MTKNELIGQLKMALSEALEVVESMDPFTDEGPNNDDMNRWYDILYTAVEENER